MCADTFNEQVFFGLVRVRGDDGNTNYEIFLINNSEKTVIIIEKQYGGFSSYDGEVIMATPRYECVNITVEPHNYVLYCGISESRLEGANQYMAVIKTSGGIIVLTFYLSNHVGYMGSLIPCVKRYGNIIRPIITKLD